VFDQSDNVCLKSIYLYLYAAKTPQEKTALQRQLEATDNQIDQPACAKPLRHRQALHFNRRRD
jgi:hypothetical protein